MDRLRNISINTIRGFITPVLNFLIIILGIRQFGKEDWGTLIHISVWISLLAFVLNWGSKDYLIRKYSANPSKVNHFFFSGFFSRNLLLPLGLVFLFFFPTQIGLSALLLVFLSHCYSSLDSLVVYHQKFGAQLTAEILGFGVVLSGIYLSPDFTLIKFLQLYCLSFLIKNIFLFSALNIWKFQGKMVLSLDQFGESLPFFLLGLSGLLGSKADLYIVNASLPKDSISDYQLLTTAFLMLQSVSGLIISPVNKQFYRSQNQTIDKLKLIFKKIAVPIVIVGGIGIWLILEKWVKLGVDFKLYGVGLMASLPSFYYIVPVFNLYKKKQEKKVLLANVIVALSNALVTFSLLPKFGILGAMISFCFSQWLYLGLILKYEK